MGVPSRPLFARIFRIASNVWCALFDPQGQPIWEAGAWEQIWIGEI
jgi:hypothetical protein